MGRAIIDITVIIASICCKVRVAFRLIKLRHYVMVDVEGKCHVSRTECSDKNIQIIITPCILSLGHLCYSLY